MAGHWFIRNANYYAPGDPTKREKYPPGVLDMLESKPWLAWFDTPNYYEARRSKRFKTHREALAYALSGGERLDLTGTER